MVTREEASEFKNIMARIILVNGWDLHALFDTGATHCFISWRFVEENGLDDFSCSEPLRVWLPN